MKLHELVKINERSKKRVGRGLGSGKGKTGGRGMKGQKARGKIPAGFIGGTLPLYKRLPYRRGIGNMGKAAETLPVSLSELDQFKSGSVVDLQSLVTQGIIQNKQIKKFAVKILDKGDIHTALTVKVPVSASAAGKIEKAGGKVIRD